MEKAKEKVKERPEAVGRECLWYLCDMFDVGSLHITIHCKDIIIYTLWCITIKKGKPTKYGRICIKYILHTRSKLSIADVNKKGLIMCLKIYVKWCINKCIYRYNNNWVVFIVIFKVYIGQIIFFVFYNL